MPDAIDAAEQLKKAKAYFNNGEFFRSHDLALDGMSAFPDDLRFPHLALLSLANAGATDLALEKFEEFGMGLRTDIEARTLLGRLSKDKGFAAQGEERLRWMAESREIYEASYESAKAAGDPGAYYPGINAAALSVWSGEATQARALAQEVLGELTGDDYWVRATRLEAQLILGDLAAAEVTARNVLALGQGQVAQMATTGRQLRRLATAMGVAPDFLAGFTPMTVIHYTGHIIRKAGVKGRFQAEEEEAVKALIASALEEHNVGAGYGALAAGADLLFAEALLARGARLHVVLPFADDDFLEQSVITAGPGWAERFHACRDAAFSVRHATEDAFLGDESLFSYGSELAMGLGVLAAQHLQAPVMQMALWDGVVTGGPVGTEADMAVWQQTGLPQQVINYRGAGADGLDDDVKAGPGGVSRTGRQVKTMLFGDVHGFSKLTDRDLPVFAESIMGAVGEVTRRFKGLNSFVNTWGDGVFIVFADAGEAARWALEVQAEMDGIDLVTLDLPPTLQLRLGGHLGPAYELMDPVVDRPNYYGAHVSRAARIEPITPEGCVYVTETFAAILALKFPEKFTCEYVGFTEMAKHYGQLRIFLLRPAGPAKGPVVLGDIERAPLQG